MEYTAAIARKRDLSRFIGRMVAPQSRRSVVACYAIAVILPVAGFVVNWLVFDLQRAPYFSLFMATVVISSLFGGRGPGIVSTAIATFFAFITAPPAWTLRIADREDVIRIWLFAILGVLISILLGVVGELQRKLNRERSILEAVFHSTGDGVITTDHEARITYLNDIAEVSTGWCLEQVKGRRVDEVFRVVHSEEESPGEISPSTILHSRGCLEHYANWLLIRQDGTRIPIACSISSTDARGLDRSVGVITFRDMSRQVETHKALVRAEKLAAVGRVSATLAHQVNNPLEAVGNLLFLIQLAADLSTSKAYAEAALQQVSRAAHFVHQTLAFAKPSETRQPVDLQMLVERVLTLYSNDIQARSAQVKTHGAGVMVHTNLSEMQQVIASLFSNALDAIGPGGIIHVRVRRCGAKARLIVADEGCGIPREHRPKLFHAFFSTKTDVGVGLGLWVAKRIVDAHQGQIQLRSCAGKGTVARVSLLAAN